MSGEKVWGRDLNPVDSVARSVARGGYTFETRYTGRIGMPPVSRPKMAGKQFGRWTVLGLSAESTTAKGSNARFVTKCVCGRYGIHHLRSLIRRKKKADTGCSECRHVQAIKRKYRNAVQA